MAPRLHRTRIAPVIFISDLENYAFLLEFEMKVKTTNVGGTQMK